MKRKILGFFLILMLLSVNVVSADVTIDTRTNSERQAKGLTILATDGILASVAATRATQIATNFAHANWIYDAIGCWEWAGENLAWSKEPNNDFVSDWMVSAGHRANILDPRFDSQGSAVVEIAGITYAVQVFRDSCDTQSEPIADPAPAPSVTKSTVEALPNTSMEKK